MHYLENSTCGILPHTQRKKSADQKGPFVMKDVKKQVKAVIFDMDGTIIHSESLWQSATKRFLASHGIVDLVEKDIKIIQSLSGIGLTESAKLIKDAYNIDESIDAIVTKKQRFAIEAIEQEAIAFIDGFEDFHALLTQHKVPNCVATNADAGSLVKFKEKMDLPKYFGNHIYHRGHVGDKAKPNPAMFLHAAKQLGVAPEECIVFEDSHFGFKAAEAAGMRCIAIKSKTNVDSLHMVHEAVESYHEALAVLRKLTGEKE